MRIALLLVALGWLAAAQPRLGGCPVFPADHIWNTPVDKLPKLANSDALVSSIGQLKPLHPDFGAAYWRGAPSGIPFVLVPGTQPKVEIRFEAAEESDPGPYPVPPGAPVEGGPIATGDRHVLVLDKDNCVLYELFSAYPEPDAAWRAGSGAIFDLKGYALRPPFWTSADAAGLPILPGLVRYDEVAAGEINHALRFTVRTTRKAFVWPGRHRASREESESLPAMGQRFRLKSDVSLKGLHPHAQVILRALQKYGMMVSDNGGNWYLSGAPDPRWNDLALRQLTKIRGWDFEAVDVTSLIKDPDSGQVR